MTAPSHLSPGESERLRGLFVERFASQATEAYRDWYRLQKELRNAGECQLSRALADDLWQALPEIEKQPGLDIGRFFNNAGAFFGTPGSAASLARAEACFSRALEAWSGDDERCARALHNRGSALAALGETPADLSRAVACFEEALKYRSSEREIARGVTLHHLGVARRKLAEIVSARERDKEGSVVALEEALAIREKHGLAEGAASTRFQLGISLMAVGRPAEGRAALTMAAGELDQIGKKEEADLARRLAEQS